MAARERPGGAVPMTDLFARLDAPARLIVTGDIAQVRWNPVPLENTDSRCELGSCCAIRAVAAIIAMWCYRLSTGW